MSATSIIKALIKQRLADWDAADTEVEAALNTYAPQDAIEKYASERDRISAAIKALNEALAAIEKEARDGSA